MKPLPLALLLLLLLACLAGAPTAHASRARDFLKKSPDWYAGPEARRIAAHILSWQAKAGGWPKNTSTTDRPATAKEQAALAPSFDNSATTGELRFLARYVQATGDTASRAAFERGYDYILAAQYPTGGWPQYHPPGKGYHRHITFNDDAMVRLLEFLRESTTAPAYAFLDAERKARARRAFDLGIECILKCQIRVDGRLTAWCAQHDEKDYSPRPARTFELVSLSGSESVGIVRLLLSLEQPSPEVKEAVEGAVAWFRAAALKGIRVVEVKEAGAPGGKDRRVVSDPEAPLLWARFYEIGSNRPIFCDRDGVPKRELAEIGHERRNGYAWLGSWPADLLNREYPAWKQREQPRPIR
jgi:PelA/Pel-15E family pectate lyase